MSRTDDPLLLQSAQDEAFMRMALQQAALAAAAGEVPVGAVVVRDARVLATGRNAPIGGHDPTAHAEVVALRAAAAAVGNYRLDGCTLYVTLEPCAMCTGAMLHARLARVVFGAPDPRTGAAGSVVDLFGDPRLNHHTVVQGRVLEHDCAELLQAFFRARRKAQRACALRLHPLRDDALRTPERAFAEVPPTPAAQSHYRTDLPALAGLRMHYRDSGVVGGDEGGSAPAWLCLHGPSGWSQRFADWLPHLGGEGGRVVAPDLPGFGRSDKPKQVGFHTPAWHAQVLAELADALGLARFMVLVEEGSEAVAAGLAAALPQQVVGIAAVPAQAGPYDAVPFPDAGHRAGPRAASQWAHDDGASTPVPWLRLQPGLPAEQIAQAVEYFRNAPSRG